MGNPLRFLGPGETADVDGFVLPARCAVEVTFNAHQSQFLLRPDKRATETLLGCLGRAYHRYPEMNIHALNVLSNHGCFVASPTSQAVLSSFMQHFLSMAAVRLNLVRDRDGTFWQRRYRAIPIVDQAKLDDRFAYVLLQGTKENLVWSARDWPGASSVKTLMGGAELVGRWHDGTKTYNLTRELERKRARAEKAGRPLPPGKIKQVWREYRIEFRPLPHWAHLEVGQRRARVTDIVRRDEEDTRRRHARAGTKPLGVRGVRATDPEGRPQESEKTPAPLCHSTTRAGRRAFRKVYDMFVSAVRGAAAELAAQATALGFGPDTTTPPVTDRSSLGPRPDDVAPVIEWEGVDRAVGPPELS